MKKIASLALLPVIALVSCGKSEETPVETTLETTSSAENEVTVQSDEITSELNSIIEEATGETLNENVSSTTTNETGTTVKEFNLTYTLPDGRPLEFSGNLEIENGKVKSVNFPKYNLTNPQTYEVKFALQLQTDIIGKEIAGLQTMV